MRLGIFGGTFDPVHLGHLLLAECCREACRLDEVWFVPAAAPPHKSGTPITPGRDRAELLEFAVAGAREYRVSRVELHRAGPSYTVDTLRQLRAERPGDELHLLLGADSLNDLALWREPAEIADLARIVAANRGRAAATVPGSVAQALGPARLARIQFVEMPAIDISSREIRERVRTGRSIRWMVPRAVEAAIAERGLYRRPPVEA